MKRLLNTGWFFAVLLTLIFCGNASATTFPKIISQAMKTLAVSKGDSDLLMMTNAPYVKVDGKALSFLDQAQEMTGCTIGKRNLLFFQRPQTHPMRLMLFKKNNGDAVIISRIEHAWFKEKLNISAATIATPSFWKTVKKDFKSGKDMFTLATIANVWAKDAPYDFLKSAELHNHICPGLTSGYMIAHYILDHYPLKKGERYTVIACPTWCKEDALQVVLDCTPGKKGMIVKHLSKKQIEKIAFTNPAGLLLIWNNKKKTGKGVALTFNFDRLKALAPKDTPKAASVLAALGHLDKPDQFVSTAAEFDLNEKSYNAIVQAGGNPYEIAGLLKK